MRLVGADRHCLYTEAPVLRLSIGNVPAFQSNAARSVAPPGRLDDGDGLSGLEELESLKCHAPGCLDFESRFLLPEMPCSGSCQHATSTRLHKTQTLKHLVALTLPTDCVATMQKHPRYYNCIHIAGHQARIYSKLLGASQTSGKQG